MIALIAILASGAVLVGGGLAARGDPLDRAAARLGQSLIRARESAVLGRVPAGFHLGNDGWQGMRLVPGQGWVASGEPVRLPDVRFDWSLALAPVQPGARDVPSLLVAPDGGVTPVTLTLSSGGRSLACALAADGGWQCG